ncbi:MAG: thymidine phosphorylase [Verrucomicrobia bacterium]|nr:thymidine phosphorylase [Verrucomicrobiota bacterium]
MNFLSLIESKRDGQTLSPDDIQRFVCEYVTGKIPDYQMAAMLMAIYFRGMTTPEIAALTTAMRDSGDVLSFPKESRPVVDKHSTGGVGDKVSLPLAPLLACLGFRVPMISGRGLGITGGTLDKLESIPGFKTAMTVEKIIEQVQSVGCVICGQTERMVPADKGLYALRDVTGTVPSIPLITASILSKKLAEGLDALLLDVKFGCAAFMQTKEKASQLADSMVTLGNECGVKTHAVLSDMNTPLGRTAGNWLEVKESVECLEGCGPDDLRDLVIECAAHLLLQTGKSNSIENAMTQAATMLASGAPRNKWDDMLLAQGATLQAFQRKLAYDSTAPVTTELRATRSGSVQKCDARIIGEIVRDLGGGRLTKETIINWDVGMDQIAKPGEQVQIGATLARIHAADKQSAANALKRLETAFEISEG